MFHLRGLSTDLMPNSSHHSSDPGGSCRPSSAARSFLFLLSCSFLFPGLPFFFLLGILGGGSLKLCDLWVSCVSWVVTPSSSPASRRVLKFLTLGMGRGNSSGTERISAVFTPSMRFCRKILRRSSWRDRPLSWSS